MAESYISHYANGEAVDAALDSGVAAQSEVVGARSSYGNLNARMSAMETSLSNKANSNSVYTKTQVDDSLEGKVDKVTGKGLSTNDYTTVEKTKLAGLQNYDDSSINGRVTTVEQSIATLNGGASTSGSVANSVAAGVSDAKDYTDTEIGKLDVASVGGAGKYIKSIEQSDGKITAVEQTMDTTPTSGSTNAVTSGGVQVAIASETKARQDAVAVVAAQGSKNLLKVTSTTQTINGVTFTVNADQTVSLSGTATATATFVIVDNATSNAIPDGSYILTGCPSGGGNNTYDLRWYLFSSGKSAYDQGSGASVNKTGNTTSSNIAILIRSGVNTDGLVFRPMLRDSEITDSTYVPYAPTNRELYELCETKASLNDIYGIKNQLPNGTDLNNLSAGIMMCPGATVAATLINCPTTTDAFIIYTDYLATTSRAIQRIYSFSTTTGIPAQYMRVRWSQGWTPWYQVTMQQVASAQSAASLMQAGRLDAELTDMGTDESDDEER